MQETIKYEAIIREKISDLKQEDKLSKVPYSYSWAETIKITKQDKNYFLKIIPYFDGCIERVKQISQIYKQNEIPSADLLECKILEETKTFYGIYEYIEGIPLNELYQSKNKTYFYQIGQQIGEHLKKLKKYESEKTCQIPKEDIEAVTEDAEQCFFRSYPNIRKIVDSYFSNEQLEKMKIRFRKLTKSFNGIEKNIIHGDIKIQNIMIQEDNPILVDYEDLKISCDMMNFRWNIDSYFHKDHFKENRAFYKGILDSLYDGDIPKNIECNVLCVCLLKFFSEVYWCAHTKNWEGMHKMLATYQRAYQETNGFQELTDLRESY